MAYERKSTCEKACFLDLIFYRLDTLFVIKTELGNLIVIQ